MKIVVASGKGGTGKTTVSVNMAVALAAAGESVGLLDCDVEEPNCHLFLKPSSAPSLSVTVDIPQVDPAYCTGCGLCARACEFNALLALPGIPLLLPELCHGCGVCKYVCPEEAIDDLGREIGQVGCEDLEGVHFRWGRLNIGEARATPVIAAVKDLKEAPPLETVIVDAPPGVACPAVETLRGGDFAILVTEPTPFGLHDLKLAVETARILGIPHGVVVNRAGLGEDAVYEYCNSADVPILLEIADDRHVAEICSRGDLVVHSDPEYAASMRALVAAVRTRVKDEVAAAGAPSGVTATVDEGGAL